MQRTFTRDGVVYQDNGDGTATVVGYADQGPPPDPRIAPNVERTQTQNRRDQVETQYIPAEKEANINRTRTQAQGDAINNQVTAATAPTTVQTNQAPAGYIWIDPNDPDKGVRPIPGYEGGDGEKLDKQKLGNLMALQGLLDELGGAYRKGPGSTGGISAVLDYLPSEANDKFNTLAASLGDVGFAAFRVPGSGVQTDADQRRFIEANTPKASDRDTIIEAKLQNVQRRVDETLKAYGMDPVDIRDEGGQLMAPDSVWDKIRFTRGEGVKAAEFGSTTQRKAFPEGFSAAMDQGKAEIMAQNGGRMDADAYIALRKRLAQEYGVEWSVPTDEEMRDWTTRFNSYIDGGGRDISPFPSGYDAPMGFGEQVQNNFLNTGAGAGVTSFADTIGFGVPTALAPEQMAAMREAQPLPSLAGSIAGAIPATYGVGALGRYGMEQLANRGGVTLASNILNSGGKAQFGRNLATDVAYGTTYGGIANGDPLMGGVSAGVGSVGGQTIARGVGAATGGVRVTPEAQRLIDKGVRVPVSRQIGGALPRVDDLMQSIPFVGGRIRNRQVDAYNDTRDALYREGGASIGYQGGADIENFGDAVSTSYRTSLGGKTIPVDQDFIPDLAVAYNLRNQLPDDVAKRVDKMMENNVSPIGDAGYMTGEQLQRGMRAMGTARNKASTVAGEFDDIYRQTMTAGQDSLTNLAMRQGSGDVVEGLKAANRANKNYKILEDAEYRARNGARSGEVGLPAPSQYVDAAASARKKFGENDILPLATDAQKTLPSQVPNSGTADRTIAANVLGVLGLGGLGLGENYATGDPSTTAKVAGTIAALAALNTRGGQFALQKLLIERPEAAKALGQTIRRRSGLFGSAGSAAALQNQ